MLWMVQKVFFGQITHQENLRLSDLGTREVFAAIPFLLLILVMGLKPQPVLDVLNHSTARFVARAKYASGEGSDDERKVRVYVRTLPKAGAVVAQAEQQDALRAPTQPPRAAVPQFAPALGALRPVQPQLPTP
jgi:NADH-quinone oxidoreductase subunit M